MTANKSAHTHTVQALLDVYTILREVGRLDNLKIGLVGDLANGRTARSLAFLMSLYSNIKFYFVAPDVVKMKDDIKQFLTYSKARPRERVQTAHGVCSCCFCMASVQSLGWRCRYWAAGSREGTSSACGAAAGCDTGEGELAGVTGLQQRRCRLGCLLYVLTCCRRVAAEASHCCRCSLRTWRTWQPWPLTWTSCTRRASRRSASRQDPAGAVAVVAALVRRLCWLL